AATSGHRPRAVRPELITPSAAVHIAQRYQQARYPASCRGDTDLGQPFLVADSLVTAEADRLRRDSRSGQHLAVVIGNHSDSGGGWLSSSTVQRLSWPLFPVSYSGSPQAVRIPTHAARIRMMQSVRSDICMMHSERSDC